MFKFEPGNYIKTNSFAEHELYWAIGCFLNSGAAISEKHAEDFHDGLYMSNAGHSLFLGMTESRELRWSSEVIVYGRKRECIDNPFFVIPEIITDGTLIFRQDEL